jgi:1,4-dihydroxy-2-naphthoate octaprenyltransferase
MLFWKRESPIFKNSPSFHDMKWWIEAARLRTLPLASATVFFGAAGIVWDRHNTLVVALAWFTAVSLQIFSNFANDWGDFNNGADNDNRVGPSRVMQTGKVSASNMKKALVILGASSFVLGMSLLYFALVQIGRNLEFFIFLTIGLLAIWAAYKYTAGNNPYGYRGLGDLFVFIFFGVVSPAGVFYFLRFTIDVELLLRIGFVGTASVMVLHLNNMRDRISDKESGKRTLSVQLGFSKSKLLHVIYGIICLMSSFFLAMQHEFLVMPLVFLCFSWLWIFIHLTFVLRVKDEKNYDPQLKIVALSTFISSALFLFC